MKKNFEKAISLLLCLILLGGVFSTGTLSALAVKTDQTITANDVEAVYGDIRARVLASTDGDGILHYTVKSGDDVIDVKDNGRLVIKKAGTAVVTVSATATADCNAATKDVNVTVSKAKPVILNYPTFKNFEFVPVPVDPVDFPGEVYGGRFFYRLTNQTDSFSAETNYSAGNIIVNIIVKGDENHKDYGTFSYDSPEYSEGKIKQELLYVYKSTPVIYASASIDKSGKAKVTGYVSDKDGNTSGTGTFRPSGNVIVTVDGNSSVPILLDDKDLSFEYEPEGISAHGTHSVSISYSGNQNYTPSSLTGAFSEDGWGYYKTLFYIADNESIMYNGSPQELVKPVTDCGDAKYMYKLSSEDTYSEKIPTATDVGTYSVDWKIVLGDAILGSDTVVATIRKPLTLSNVMVSKQYDGSALVGSDEINIELSGLDKEHSVPNSSTDSSNVVTVTAKGKFADPNAGEDKEFTFTDITLKGKNADLYAITPESLDNITGTITPAPVTVEWESDSEYRYTGKQQCPEAFPVGVLPFDTNITTFTVSGAQTNIGSGYTATVTGISNSNYSMPAENLTCPFEIKGNDPQLTAPEQINKTEDDDSFTIETTTAKGFSGSLTYNVISGDDVVSVDKNGKVTLLKAGKATVRITTGNDSAYFVQNKDVGITVSAATYDAILMADGKQYGKAIQYTIYQTALNLPAVPEKKGYTGKWEDYTLKRGGITINAVYTGNEYKAVFKADGKTVDTVPYTFGDKALSRVPTVPEKEGCTGKWKDYTLDLGGITVKAVYTPNEYIAVFRAEGKTVAEVPYTFGDKVLSKVPSVPKKEGYTGKWGKYTLGVGGADINAVYTLNEYGAVFIADGKTVDTVAYKHGDTALSKVPSVPEKEGYTGKWEEYTLVAGGITVNAVYTPNEYIAVFRAEGKTVAEVPYTFGDKVLSKVPSVPEKEGCNGKWKEYTLGVGGADINAVYTLNEYSAVFIADGKTIDTVAYKHGDKVLSKVPSVPEKEGYTGKWAEFTLAAGGITVNAIYTPADYIAVFTAEGKKVAEVPYTFGDTELSSVPAVPEKEGYIGAWAEFTLTAGGITVNAVYTPKEYIAVFTADGRTVAEVPYTFGDTELSFVPAVPEKKGCMGTWAEFTLAAGGITVNAVYTPNEFIAVFIADGKTVAEVPYTLGDTELSSVPAVPEKEGYSGKWKEYTPGKGGITINAEYIANTYCAKFIADGRQVGKDIPYTFGETVLKNIPSVPSKAGYTGVWEEYALCIGGITVNAVYTPNKYSAVFTAEGKAVDTVLYTYGDKALSYIPAVPEKEGYTVLWENFSLGIGGVTVKAVYAPVKCSAVFIAEGIIIGTVPYTYGDTVLRNIPSVPAKAGYTGAWESYMLTADGVTVNAVYTPNKYNAIFVADGITVDIVRYTYGDKVLSRVPAVPAKTVYTGRWEDYTLTLGGITVKAIYTPAEYIAMFTADGKTVKEVPYTYGDKALSSVPVVPEKEGYTGRWEEYELCAGGITVNAVYTPNIYSAVFTAEGKTVKEVYYTFGDKVLSSVPAVPSKTGFTATWEEYVLGAANITVKAVYTPHEYTAVFIAGGDAVAQIPYTFGDKELSSVPPVPEVDGCTGIWEEYTLGAGGVTVNAVYTAVPCEVQSVSIDDMEIYYTDAVILVPAISATGEYTVEFSSSDYTTAYVDGEGFVIGMGKGSAEITCMVTDRYGNSVSDTCTVTVRDTLFHRIITGIVHVISRIRALFILIFKGFLL